MRNVSTLLLASAFVLAGPCFAQTSSTGSAAVADSAKVPTPPQAPSGPTVTINSHVEAFAAGPMGDLHSLFLKDGTVAELPPDVGTSLATHIRRDSDVKLTGTQIEVAGQKTVLVKSVVIGGQTFTAIQPGNGPAPGFGPGGPGRAAGGPPPPPPGGPGAPPPPPPGMAAGGPPPPCQGGQQPPRGMGGRMQPPPVNNVPGGVANSGNGA